MAATAETREDVIREFKSALKFHIEGLCELGLDAPEIESLDFHELAPV